MAAVSAIERIVLQPESDVNDADHPRVDSKLLA